MQHQPPRRQKVQKDQVESISSLLEPTAPEREREYSLLETSKIQAACGLTDAQWETDLPELYTRMLEEGRATAKVKALLEDIFRPDGDFSLAAVQINVTDELAKDIKNINLGCNNDMSYKCCQSRNRAVCDDRRVNGYGQQTASDGRSVHKDQ